MQRGRYASGADLVRPYDEGGTRKPPAALLIWIGAVLLAGGLFLLPAFDRIAMQAPLRSLVAGVRARNAEAMRQQFTPSGRVGYQDYEFPAGAAIEAALPAMRQYAGEGNLRLASVDRVTPAGPGRMTVRFTVAFDVSGEELPYHGVPMRREGTAVLQRVGWFRWKIARLTSAEQEFGEALQALMLPHLLPGLVSPEDETTYE